MDKKEQIEFGSRVWPTFSVPLGLNTIRLLPPGRNPTYGFSKSHGISLSKLAFIIYLLISVTYGGITVCRYDLSAGEDAVNKADSIPALRELYMLMEQASRK